MTPLLSLECELYQVEGTKIVGSKKVALCIRDEVMIVLQMDSSTGEALVLTDLVTRPVKASQLQRLTIGADVSGFAAL